MKKHLYLSAILLLGATAFAQQPYVGCWHPEEIREWSPATDPDAAFNRAKVPLARRATESAPMKANEAQQYGGRITDATILHPMCSVIPSQGAQNFLGYQPTYWQYMDLLVHWAGSASEGIIIPPPAGTVDAAHAQGVKVLGQIFFPPSVFGGKSEWVDQILSKENGKFIFARKLYEIAEYCGFDGWFLNEETNHGTSPLWPEFIKEFNAIADADGHPEMEIQWYNASLTPNTSILGAHPNTSQFLEYGSAGDLTSWAGRITYPDGSHPADIFSTLYAGIEVSQAGHTNYGGQLRRVFPTTGHVGSAALFCPEERTWKDNVRELLNTPSDATGEKAWAAIGATFDKEAEMWVNPNGDPSRVPSTGFPGISGAIVERTAITSAPFLSYMSVGVGKHRFINGRKAATGDWYHSGMQSVLPTWRWWLENAGGVKASIDWDDAWTGPSSFMFKGSLAAGSHLLRLYKTSLSVTGNLRARVYYKSELTPLLCISTTESLTPDKTIAASEITESNGWKCAVYPLPEAGKIHMFALDLKASAPMPDFKFALGGFSVLPDNTDNSFSYGNLQCGSELGVEEGDLRLTWTSEWTPAFDRFDIYLITADGVRTLAGQTRDDAYYVPAFPRSGNDAGIKVEVVPVMADGSEKTPLTLDVPYPEPAAPELSVHISKSYLLAGEEVTLTAHGTGAPDSYAWTLPEGVVLTEGYTLQSNPVVLKALTAGEKEVRVEAVNNIGTGSKTLNAFDVFADAEAMAAVGNVALNKKIIGFSSMTNFNESPANILDGVTNPTSVSAKWCSTDNDNYVTIDLGDTYRIYGVRIYDGNYGPESGVPQIASYTVSLFQDTEGDLPATIISRKGVADLSLKEDYCAPSTGRYVRLDTHTDGTLRIWEFEVIGQAGYSGIGSITADGSDVRPVAYYSVEGVRLSAPGRGITVVVYSDGSTGKIVRN